METGTGRGQVKPKHPPSKNRRHGRSAAAVRPLARGCGVIRTRARSSRHFQVRVHSGNAAGRRHFPQRAEWRPLGAQLQTGGKRTNQTADRNNDPLPHSASHLHVRGCSSSCPARRLFAGLSREKRKHHFSWVLALPPTVARFVAATRRGRRCPILPTHRSPPSDVDSALSSVGSGQTRRCYARPGEDRAAVTDRPDSASPARSAAPRRPGN